MAATRSGWLRAPLCLSIVLAAAAHAAPLTPGNVVVYRVGSGGASSLVATGNPVFLDEYTPAGVKVQTIPMPSAATGDQKALVASGTATTDGLMTRSADGNCLVVPGYSRDIGTGAGNLTTTGTQANGSAIPRMVGKVTAVGTVDTTTALTDASLQSNFRGAASGDCANVWVSGTAGTTGGGVRYTTFGSTTSGDLTSTSFANTRAAVVANGQLYASASVTALRTVATVGSGLPTSGAQAVAKLPGLPDPAANAQPYAFFFARPDMLYIADESTGINKFSLVNNAWISNGAIGTSTDTYRGITGTVSGTTVTLYAVRKGGSTATGGGEIVSLVDASGFNATLSGTLTVVATAAANTAFRGIAMAPEVTITPSAGAHGSISPSTAQVAGGGQTRMFTVIADPGFSAVVAGTCGGSLVGVTFTTDPAGVNCTVVASFVQIPTFTATPSAGPGGSIAPSTSRTLLVGQTTSFTIASNPGYSFAVGGTCGGGLVGNVYTIAPIAADCTVTADFTLITFNVTPSAGSNGSISPASPQAIPQGTSASFTVTPDFGFGASMSGTCGGTLNGSTYATNPIVADCTVVASFPLLPRYTVTPSATAHGTISPPMPLTVIQGQSTSFDVNPDAGYNAAVRGTCGGHFVENTYFIQPASADCTVSVTFARKLVLFVGNSFTFGRADPIMSYNTANVTDLTLDMWIANKTGANDDEPHPWGGIPGVFKKLTDEAGLEYDVSISARNAATLRGQYLDSNPAGWDLRGNMASQRWDTVVLQELSDGPLPAGRGANADLPNFNAYVDKIEQYVHLGTTDPNVPANLNARLSAQVFLYETWARPDMIGPNGDNTSGLFYSAAEGLEAMTADLHDGYFGRAMANPNIEDVSPVGDAFLRAVIDGVAMRDPYVPDAGKIDLWYTDFFHPSKYGSYLSALVHFQTITGINPLTLGPSELAAADLGIAPDIAVKLQRVAQEVVDPDSAAPVTTVTVSDPPNAAGWNRDNVTVTLSATDAGGSGLDSIHYTLAGAQAGTGSFASSGSITVSAEGVTTITYYATDRAGNAEPSHTLKISIDRTPPTIAGMPGSACNLWPPNNKMVVVATVSATDRVSSVTSFSVVASDNVAPIAGRDDVSIAGNGLAPRTVSLRASTGTAGNARAYTITATATDAAGNSVSAVAECEVQK